MGTTEPFLNIPPVPEATPLAARRTPPSLENTADLGFYPTKTDEPWAQSKTGGVKPARRAAVVVLSAVALVGVALAGGAALLSRTKAAPPQLPVSVASAEASPRAVASAAQPVAAVAPDAPDAPPVAPVTPDSFQPPPSVPLASAHRGVPAVPVATGHTRTSPSAPPPHGTKPAGSSKPSGTSVPDFGY